MGSIFGVKCEKCDYRFTVDIGHGFLGCGFFEPGLKSEKPRFYDYINSKRILSDIEELIETKNDVWEDKEAYSRREQWRGHGSAQYICPNCGRLHNKFYFRLKYDGGFYEPKYYCSSCKRKLVCVELISAETESIIIKSDQKIDWKCPNCGGKKLIFDVEAGYTCYD